MAIRHNTNHILLGQVTILCTYIHMQRMYKDSRYTGQHLVTNNILMSINYHFSPYKNLDSRTHPKYHKWTAIQGIFGVSPIIIMPTVDDLHNWYMSQGVNLLSIQCCNIWPQQQTQRLHMTYILTYTITFAFGKIQVCCIQLVPLHMYVLYTNTTNAKIYSLEDLVFKSARVPK